MFVAALAFILLPANYKERVFSIGQYTGSRSVQTRVNLQNAALRVWQDHPILGAGPGGYGLSVAEMTSPRIIVGMVLNWEKYYRWDTIDIGAHNMYLQTLAEGGIVGLGLLLTFFVVIWWRLHAFGKLVARAGDERGRVLCASVEISLLVFFVCAIFLHALDQKIAWMVYALAAAVPIHYALAPPTETALPALADEELDVS